MPANAMLFLGAVLGLAVSAGPRPIPGIPGAHGTRQFGAVIMETQAGGLRIEPIRLTDLASASAMSSGAGDATAAALGAARLGATYSISVPSISAFVRRDLERVWKLTIPAGSSARPRVSATVESARGESGRLSLSGHDEVSIPVVVLERAATLRVDNDGNGILEGGVSLQIPSASLQRAGQYAGRLVLRTEGF